MKCGELLAFTQDMTVRLAELHDLLPLTPLQHLQVRGIQTLVRQHRPGE